MKALITGAGGQLGRELARSAPPNIEVHCLRHSNCDVTQRAPVERALLALQPDVVINAAAFTKVDQAEDQKERAFAVNEEGARNVAEVCAVLGTLIVQVSTDFVFDGTRSTPYPTEAVPSPINVYGASKLAGEEAVRTSGAPYVILRCGWLYSAMPGNFLTKTLGLLQAHRSLRVVDDQIGVPTAAVDVAQTIWWCAAADASVKNSVLHWASMGSASRYEFAVAIQEFALEAGLLDVAEAIVPIKTAEHSLPARRPPYSVLDAKATWRAMGRTPPDWRVRLATTIAGMPHGGG